MQRTTPFQRIINWVEKKGSERSGNEIGEDEKQRAYKKIWCPVYGFDML
ncbi:hypothetical protein ACFSBF_11650 [Sphingobacterium suaedae]